MITKSASHELAIRRFLGDFSKIGVAQRLTVIGRLGKSSFLTKPQPVPSRRNHQRELGIFFLLE